MNSCIYQGRVLHRRFHPVPHDFTYKLFMLYLDLAELDQVFQGSWFWSSRRPNVAWFRRREHLGDNDVPLDVCVRQLIKQRTGEVHTGPIHLLTHLRYFGFQMNPVSFFFCFDNDKRLKHIVAEVNNTPWGQQHCYVLDPQHFCPQHDGPRQMLSKDFHVSPFLPMDMKYQWRVTSPAEKLNIGIANFRNDQRMLNVAMTMKREPISAASLRRMLVRYPLMTGKVFAGIYWQALRLKAKKVPFFSHPDKQTAQADEASTTPAENPNPDLASPLLNTSHQKNYV